MVTRHETLKNLCKSVITRLENQKAILLPSQNRHQVYEEVYQLVRPNVFTDEDMRDRTLEMLGKAAESVDESQFSENEQFRAAKSIVRKSFGDDVLNGFYFQKPIKHLADQIVVYLMGSKHVEEVFEEDESLERMIVETVRRFDPKNQH